MEKLFFLAMIAKSDSLCYTLLRCMTTVCSKPSTRNVESKLSRSQASPNMYVNDPTWLMPLRKSKLRRK